MSKLIMLCGLPASGKSTLATKLSIDENARLLSSDDIRKELFGDEENQSNNQQAFEVMNSRAKIHLENGENIIYDATNINRRRRKHLINHELKIADEKVVYYMNTHVDDCATLDSRRYRRVGDKVISKMYKTLQIPVVGEGWDEVIIVSHRTRKTSGLRADLEDILLTNKSYKAVMGEFAISYYEFEDIFELPQDSKHHSFSVSRHTYHVYDYIKTKTSDLRLLWTAILHDVGKGYCKSFKNFKGEETKYANFIGHEYVSSQIAMNILNELGYDDRFVKDVSTLCQFHMYPMSAGEKKMKEINELLGEELYRDLLLLHEADLQAK